MRTGTAQPTPYLLYDYNPGSNNTRVFAKAVCSDLTIKWDPGSYAGFSATIMSFASGVVANPSTIPPSYSSFSAVPGRVGTVSIGGNITGKVMSCEFALKRDEFGEIPTLQGVQDPLAIFAGPAGMTCKSTIVVDDDTVLSISLATINTKPFTY